MKEGTGEEGKGGNPIYVSFQVAIVCVLPNTIFVLKKNL